MTPATGSTSDGLSLRSAPGPIVILTGAGVSVESGVPTFRGADGLWRQRRPEELATPEAFRRDPRLVWEWYRWRRRVVAACAPNAAHLAIARVASERPDVTIITQNVDGLHTRAARDVGEGALLARAIPLELHGALFRDRCTSCDWRGEAASTVQGAVAVDVPSCPSCGAMARPDVVWFGEALNEAVLGAAFRAASEAATCLVVGTSGLVHPAASLPLATVAAGGAVIEVNPEPTPLTRHATRRVAAAAAAVLPGLLG